MPLIKITKEAIDKSKPPTAGWHLGTIQSFKEEDNKEKKRKDYVFEIPITEDGENNGRYMYARFYSTAPGFWLSTGFLAAVLDITEVTEETEFDPNEFVGRQVYGNVVVSTYEGKLQHRTEQFAPASKPPF
jgi:hypothetical protein